MDVNLTTQLKYLPHDWLISLVREYFPVIPNLGVCNGVTSMWIQAVISSPEQEKVYYNRFDWLSNYASATPDPNNSFKALKDSISAIYNSQQDPLDYVDRSAIKYILDSENGNSVIKYDFKLTDENYHETFYNGTINLRPQENALAQKSEAYILSAISKKMRTPLTQEELDKVAIPAFVESVALQQDANLLNISKEYIFQNDKLKLFEYTASSMLEAENSTIQSNVVGTIALNRNDLAQYFDKLKGLLSLGAMIFKPKKRSAFLLTSDDHGVGLYFDEKSDKWHYFDINYLSGKTEYYFAVDSTELANLVFKSFADENNEHTVFSMLYLSCEPELSLIHLLQETTLQCLSNKSNSRGLSAFWVATFSRDVASVKYLLSCDPKPNLEEKSKNGWTPLMLAATRGNAEMLNLLLAADPRPNLEEKNNSGSTALLLAAINGHAHIVKILLSADPKPNLEATVLNGCTALWLAADKGHAHVVEELLKSTPKPMINAQTSVGCTALMTAVSHSHLDVVNILLNANPKPDLEAQLKTGNTVLMVAALSGHVKIVEALLKADPKPNVLKTNHKGETALDLAEQFKHTQIIELLRQAEIELQAERALPKSRLYFRAIRTKATQTMQIRKFANYLCRSYGDSNRESISENAAKKLKIFSNMPVIKKIVNPFYQSFSLKNIENPQSTNKRLKI